MVQKVVLLKRFSDRLVPKIAFNFLHQKKRETYFVVDFDFVKLKMSDSTANYLFCILGNHMYITYKSYPDLPQ